MKYYIHLDGSRIIGCGNCPTGNSIEVDKELYKDYLLETNKYILSNKKIVLNPNYEQEQTQKRQKFFNAEFFNTSLGYIRRKVNMSTGEIKDFLSDLLPTISMAVNSGNQVHIISYSLPDFTTEPDMTQYKTVVLATTQFVQECFSQLSNDFLPVAEISDEISE